MDEMQRREKVSASGNLYKLFMCSGVGRRLKKEKQPCRKEKEIYRH